MVLCIKCVSYYQLRYHSIKQIHDNIEWLERQLRNNNFKPREEQKILDEISMLQRSIRTLREYEAKQVGRGSFERYHLSFLFHIFPKILFDIATV